MDYISFDVIITDYNSRESSGIGLLQQTRQKGIMTPFIFFTLEQNVVIEQEATRYDSVVFVPKILRFGSNIDNLEETLRIIVRLYQSEDKIPKKDLSSSIDGGISS